MAISSGFQKVKNYIKSTDGTFKLLSRWTSSQTVEYSDGKTAQEKNGVINGITSDVNCEDPTIAASASMVGAINQNLTPTGGDGTMNMADMVKEIYNVVADAPSFGLIYHNVGSQSSGVLTTYTFQKGLKRAFWVGINKTGYGVGTHQTNVNLSSGKATELLNQILYTDNRLNSVVEVIQLDDVKDGDSVTYTYSHYHVVFVFG